MKKRHVSLRSAEIVSGYLFFLPWVVGFLTFTLYPVIYSVLLSLNEVQIVSGETHMTWKGLAYFNQAWNVDTQFKPALGNTMMLIGCSLPVILVLSLIIAVMLNSRFRLRTFFRLVFFLPVIIMSGPVISSLLTKYTVNFMGENTPVYDFVMMLPSFFKTPITFILDNLVLILWFSGIQILVFLTGIQKISPDLYEAASIDGAGDWEKFWKITLPHLRPFAVICAVYTVITVANYSENAVNKKITAHIFDFNQMYSYSAAMSWIYFLWVILILAAVFLLFALFGRRARK